MKLNNLKTSVIVKALFLMALILCNMYVEGSEALKIQKTLSKYGSINSNSNSYSKNSVRRSSNKVRMANKDKLKNFFIGFLIGFVAKALGGKNLAEKIISTVVDSCLDKTFLEYELIKKEFIKKKPCDIKSLREFLGEEFLQAEVTCARYQIVKEMFDNEFSTKNRMKGFFNKEFNKKKDKAKEERDALYNQSRRYIDVFKPKLEKIKNDNSAKFSQTVKTTAKALYDKIDRILFFPDKNFCDSLNECSPLGLRDHLKILGKTGLSLLKCSINAQIKEFATEIIKSAILKVFEKLGLKMITNIAGSAFPPLLLGLIGKFLIENAGDLNNLYKSVVKIRADDPKNQNEERSLWIKVGSKIGGLIYSIVTMRRRILKRLK